MRYQNCFKVPIELTSLYREVLERRIERSPIGGDGASSSQDPRDRLREDFRRRNRVYTLERLSPVSQVSLGDSSLSLPLIYESYREFRVLSRLRLRGKIRRLFFTSLQTLFAR